MIEQSKNIDPRVLDEVLGDAQDCTQFEAMFESHKMPWWRGA